MANYRKFRKPMPIQGTNLVAVGMGFDVNGNSTIRFQHRDKGYGEGGFSIQTNGNLPTAHRVRSNNAWMRNREQISREVRNYVMRFRTPRQQMMATFIRADDIRFPPSR